MLGKIRKLVHGLLEILAVARGQAEQPRLIRLLEVVHITSIRAGGRYRRRLLDHLVNQRHPPESGQPPHKNVIAVYPGLEPKPERIHSVFLPHNPFLGGEFPGGPESERIGATAPANLIGR